jgi:hypothetical protein
MIHVKLLYDEKLLEAWLGVCEDHKPQGIY